MDGRLSLPARVALVSCAVAACAAAATAGPAAAGAFAINRVLPGEWELTTCTEGSVRARCFLVELHGHLQGLGSVTVEERVLQSGDMDTDLCEPQVRYGTIRAPRGTIEYVSRGIDCPATRELNGGYRAVDADWVVVGGSGAYAGVTGHGSESVRPDEEEVFIHLHGTLDVPGLTPDTAAPTFTSVPRGAIVRAKAGAPVRYPLPTARDAVDGTVPVTCYPAPGGRLPAGRSLVRCEAVDASGNVSRTSFTVTVRRPR